MQQAMLIFNPVAGKGNLKNNLFKVVDRLTKAGYLVSVYPTQGRGDGRKQVAALEGQMSLLVVSGGDVTPLNLPPVIFTSMNRPVLVSRFV